MSNIISKLGLGHLTIAAIAALSFAGALGFTPAQASESNCTTCTPPTGAAGYRWFTTRDNSTITCQTAGQTITQSYQWARVGFKADGTIGAIRIGPLGTTNASEILIAGSTTCLVPF